MPRERDEELLIDVELPAGFTMSFDPETGMPRADMEEPEEEVKETKKKDEPKPEDEELIRLRRERDELAAARERAEAEIAAREKKAREAEEALEAQVKIATEREGQVLTSHLHRVASDYRTIQTQIQTMESSAASIDAMAASLEREATAASEAGNHAQANSIQRKIAQLEAQKLTHENGIAAAKEQLAEVKSDYEKAYTAATQRKSEKEPPKQETKKDEPTPQQQKPTPDQWIENAKQFVGEEGVGWLKQNKEFVTDERKNRKLLRFAEDYADDHGQDALKSPAFVKALNDKFFPKAKQEPIVEPESEEDEIEEEVEERPVRAKAAVSAPVSRGKGPGGSANGSTGKVRLSAEEQSTAVQLYPELDRNAALKRYGANKLKAMAEGKLSR